MHYEHSMDICSLTILSDIWGETPESIKESLEGYHEEGRRLALVFEYSDQHSKLKTLEKAGFKRLGTYVGNDGPTIVVLAHGLKITKVRPADKKPRAKKGASAPKPRRRTRPTV